MANKYQEYSKAPVIDMNELPTPVVMQRRTSCDSRDDSNKTVVTTFSEKSRLEQSGCSVVRRINTGDTIGYKNQYEYKYNLNGTDTFNGLPATKTRRKH